MDIPFRQANAANFTQTGSRKIAYIVIHYTANNGDTAANNIKYFETAGRNASAHYFVDENEIWQSVRDGDIAWHCGAKQYKHAACGT